MANYRVYLLGHDGHIANAIELDCADDPAAMESAKQLVGEHPGDLWQLDAPDRLLQGWASARSTSLKGRSGLLVSVFYEFFSLAKFAFSLIPKLLISTRRTAIFVPDLSGADSNVFFIGFCKRNRPLFQFFSQFQYSLDRLAVADHPRQLAVLTCFSQNTGDETFPVHGDPLELRMNQGPSTEMVQFSRLHSGAGLSI